MKFKLFFLAVSILFASSLSAQSFFKPLPKPTATQKLSATATATPLTQNLFRPIAGVTAIIYNDGTSLAGGTGISFQHLQFDDAAQTWVTQYSVSAVAFLDTKASLTGGLVFGILNDIIQIGPGYNFTTGKPVLITGIGIHFNN